MKTYIADIIPKIQRFSQRIDDITKLTNQHWVSLGDINQTKRVFIFRTNNQLLISDNGIVEMGNWEYLGNQSLLIKTKQKNYLLKHGFFDENVIALKLDSTDSYAFFVNETRYQRELNKIEDILLFLENKYLNKNQKQAEITEINRNNIKNHYKLIKQAEDFDFSWGSYTNYLIKFSSKKIGNIYKGKKSGKYFWSEKGSEIIYTKEFDDAVYAVFLFLHKK